MGFRGIMKNEKQYKYAPEMGVGVGACGGTQKGVSAQIMLSVSVCE